MYGTPLLLPCVPAVACHGAAAPCIRKSDPVLPRRVLMLLVPVALLVPGSTPAAKAGDVQVGASLSMSNRTALDPRVLE